MNRKDALSGALVADAAAMGLHWMYDQEQIKKVALTGDILFRQPDAAVFKDQRGHFAHSALRSGELSQYGESARVVGQLALDESEYSTTLHRQRFFETFGPCGHYVGYPDKATQSLIAKIIIDADEIDDASGMDDNQMPGICVVPGLFSANHTAETISTATQVISTHPDVVAGANAVYQCLDLIAQGKSLSESLRLSAEKMPGEVGKLMRESLAIKEYKPVETSKEIGLACYVEHALPVVWYLLNNATDYESVLRDNIRCGGDSCGRSMALGSIAGLVFGVPEALISRMKEGRIPLS